MLSLGNGAMERPTLGRYQLEKQFGSDAMEVVCPEKHPKIARRVVAINAVALSQALDLEVLDQVKTRFFRDAEAAGRLNHPTIGAISMPGKNTTMPTLRRDPLKVGA